MGLLSLGLIRPFRCSAETVSLKLKNGDRISGVVSAEDTGKVTIQSPLFGTLTIPAGEIESREVISATLPAPGTSTNSPPIQSALAAQTNAVPDRAKAVVSVPQKAPVTPKKKRWDFDVQLGLNLQYNQHDTELYYGTFHANYAGIRYRDIIDYKVNYGKTDGIRSADNMYGSWRVEMDWSKREFVFNSVGAGYDDLRKIDLMYEDSFGVGFKLITRTNFNLTADTGLNFQRQYFSNDGDKTFIAGRLAEKINWKATDKLEFLESFEFFPRSFDAEDFRLRFESSLRYILSSYLNLSISILDQYDTQPATDVSRNDFQIRSTLGVHF